MSRSKVTARGGLFQVPAGKSPKRGAKFHINKRLLDANPQIYRFSVRNRGLEACVGERKET